MRPQSEALAGVATQEGFVAYLLRRAIDGMDHRGD